MFPNVLNTHYKYWYLVQYKKNTTSFPAIPATLKASLPATQDQTINEHED